MARLQDFSDVTPSSSSDKLLIVQSAGQGLATLDTAGQQIANNTRVSQLHTTSKTLAGAINEHDSEIGSLSQLTTSVTSSLVGAVNEVNANKVDGTTPLFKLKTSGNITKTIAGGAFAQILGSDIALTESGYSPMAICGIYSNQANVCLVAFDSRFVAGSGQFALIRNVSTSQVTAIMNVAILFVRDDLD